MEHALQKAARSRYGAEHDIRATIDPKTGEILLTIGAEAEPSQAGKGAVGMYHIAWEVPTLHELEAMRERLAKAGALVVMSDHGTNKSLYAHDPDGLEFEVMWLVPAAHWGTAEHEAIIEAIRKGDAEAARTAARAHIQKAGAELAVIVAKQVDD